MLDYDKLKKGDLVMAELAQTKGKQYRAVVVEPVQWRPGSQAGRIGLRVDHHADLVRWLSVHRTQGVETGGLDELHPWMIAECVDNVSPGERWRYSIPWGSGRMYVGLITENVPRATSYWLALCTVPWSAKHYGKQYKLFDTREAAESALATIVAAAMYPEDELINGKSTPEATVAK